MRFLLEDEAAGIRFERNVTLPAEDAVRASSVMTGAWYPFERLGYEGGLPPARDSLGVVPRSIRPDGEEAELLAMLKEIPRPARPARSMTEFYAALDRMTSRLEERLSGRAS